MDNTQQLWVDVGFENFIPMKFNVKILFCSLSASNSWTIFNTCGSLQEYRILFPGSFT